MAWGLFGQALSGESAVLEAARFYRRHQLFSEVVAIYEAQRNVAGAPGLPVDLYAHALHRLGRYEQAREVLINNSPRSNWCQVALADLLFATDRSRYEEALSNVPVGELSISELLYYLKVSTRASSSIDVTYQNVQNAATLKDFKYRPEDNISIRYMSALISGSSKVQAEMARKLLFNIDAASGPENLSRPALVALSEIKYNAGVIPKRGKMVSVIMTAFQSAGHLYFSAKSILSQSHRNLELIIVDDAGPEDGSGHILERLLKEDPRVKVFRTSQNVGTYVAKNFALKLAQGEFVTFHDSDDWAHPSRIEEHVKRFQWRPWLVATQSLWVKAYTSGELSQKEWGAFAYANPASIMVKREVVSKIGYFDTVRIGADSEFNARIKLVFGPGRYGLIRRVLTVGTVRNDALTATGVGAMDLYGYNPVRSAYGESWRRWHLQPDIGKGSFLAGDFLNGCPFPKPDKMPVLTSDQVGQTVLLKL